MNKRCMPQARLLVVFVLIGFSCSTLADSLDSIGRLNQAQFLEFSEELSAATSYKAVAPPESLGVIGFDIGLEVSSTDISGDLFDLASSGSFDGSDLIVPRLHVHKGLPFGIDLGASLSAIPDSDATIIGGELRYAVVDGGVLTPAVGLRIAHTQMTGIDEFEFNSTSLELGISKGFLPVTPYGGIGIVRSNSSPIGSDTLSDARFDLEKLFVGVTFSIGFALTLEADITGDIRTYSAKVGARF